MNRKAIIVGIRKEKLTLEEKSFLTREKPWGVILFSRNIKDLNQLKSLVGSIKDIFKDALKCNKPAVVNVDIDPKALYSFRRDSFKHKEK